MKISAYGIIEAAASRKYGVTAGNENVAAAGISSYSSMKAQYNLNKYNGEKLKKMCICQYRKYDK
jgi:hypothetical protein